MVFKHNDNTQSVWHYDMCLLHNIFYFVCIFLNPGKYYMNIVVTVCRLTCHFVTGAILPDM